MSGWLSRASSLFQKPPPVPQPFEVECDCGEKVAGQRLSVYQKPGCPRCERPVFVLPANVYPEPRQKTKSKANPAKGDKKSSRSPNTVVDDGASNPKAEARKKNTDAQSAEATPAIAKRSWAIPLPRMTPLRIVTTAILLFSSVTMAGLWYRYRIESAKAIVAQSADVGLEALREQEFSKAAVELNRARQAVDILGRTDFAANEIRRNSREATTLARLATSTLIEVIEETVVTTKSEKGEQPQLSSLNKGAWMIFDSRVQPIGNGNSVCRVDAPLVVGPLTIYMEVDSSAVRNACPPDETGELPRVIFAAQLEQFRFPNGQPQVGVLTLNGKTAFLWTSYDTFAAAGYHPFDTESDDQTRALLKRQREQLQN